jgi:hypothetical protein
MGYVFFFIILAFSNDGKKENQIQNSFASFWGVL